MIFIFGGAYQGKLAYALERYGFKADDVYHCSESDKTLPCGMRVIDGLEKWLLALVRAGEDTGPAVARLALENPDAVIICTDVTCGVVPVDPELRIWRESVGRALAMMVREADEAVRVFCGLGTRLR